MPTLHLHQQVGRFCVRASSGAFAVILTPRSGGDVPMSLRMTSQVHEMNRLTVFLDNPLQPEPSNDFYNVYGKYLHVTVSAATAMENERRLHELPPAGRPSTFLSRQQ